MTEAEIQNIKIGDKVQNICHKFCRRFGKGQIGTILDKDKDGNYEISWNNGKTSTYDDYSMKVRLSSIIVQKNEFDLLNGGQEI